MRDLEEMLKNFKGKYYIPNDDEVDYEKLYEQQRQYVYELEDRLTTELEENYQLENKWYSEIKRADELENTLADIKSHLNNLWHNGDATEHEYAYNTLKYIESLQEDDNA